MRFSRLYASICVLWFATVNTTGQSSAPQIIVGGPPVSLSRQLQQHNVEPSRSGLLASLHNPDQQVRSLAALRLAELKEVGSIPAIEKALARETAQETRTNMAFALAQLGKKEGITELARACDRRDLPGYLRLEATAYLLSVGKNLCFDATLDVLNTDPDSRTQALSMLPRYRDLSREQSGEMTEVAVRYLNDESGSTRTQASATLAELADPSAIPYLENAISNESDDAVRAEMQQNLESLRRRQTR